jgi:outer membrane protein assembly factor BamA
MTSPGSVAIIALIAAMFPISSPAAETAAETTAETAPQNTLIPIPFYFYTPETESGFGALTSYYFRTDGSPAARPSTLTLMFVYTTKKQASVLLGGEVYTRNGERRWRGEIAAAEFPNTFWGIGNDTPDEFEEDYTPRAFSIGLGFERRMRDVWYVGPRASAVYRTLHETEDDGALAGPAIPGTNDGWVVRLGATLSRDTRDLPVQPRTGSFQMIEADVAETWWGSDYAYTSFTASHSQFFSRGRSPVIGGRVLVRATTSTPPFDLLPQLGGDSLLRGIFEGRHRDRQLLAGQIEVRLPIWRRVGAAVFAAAGQVSPAFDRFRIDGFHASGGGGLRYMVNTGERLNIRADFGVGEGQSGFYLAIGEAF